MSPVLVLCPVRGVAEGLGAAGKLAGVGLLPGVGAQVRLQVLQAGVGLGAALELKKRLEQGDYTTMMGSSRLLGIGICSVRAH